MEREVGIAYLVDRVEGSAISITRSYINRTHYFTDNNAALKEAREMVEELRSLTPSNRKS